MREFLFSQQLEESLCIIDNNTIGRQPSAS